jgi:hypothetical protein
MHAFLIYPMSVPRLARDVVYFLMQQASLDYNTIQEIHIPSNITIYL